jgi:hypothetical protein
VIPLIDDKSREWGSSQVMTQVIRQQPIWAALDPHPMGSEMMGDQKKEIVSYESCYAVILLGERCHPWETVPIIDI